MVYLPSGCDCGRVVTRMWTIMAWSSGRNWGLVCCLSHPELNSTHKAWGQAELGPGCACGLSDQSGVCQIFEENLKKLNPDSGSITCDVQNLFDFIDRLADLSCLVWQSDLDAYTAHNKEWIKDQIYTLLRKQASTSSR
uniref:Enhancer of rudimentary homolog n=1 Tax=Ascaris lumbricoides TaxID=6252 RepID=A0A0M3IH05_ASCLU